MPGTYLENDNQPDVIKKRRPIMTHIITNLCLRDNGCIDVCPVECINPGTTPEQWPTYYIDPGTCIDCGACIPECPYHAI